MQQDTQQHHLQSSSGSCTYSLITSWTSFLLLGQHGALHQGVAEVWQLLAACSEPGWHASKQQLFSAYRPMVEG